MRITRLRLQEIRRHRDLELRPAPGLTVIRGPNESGKSTIQLALELVLFRRATTTAAEFASVRSWGATGDPIIELDFDLDGRPGRLAKRFAGSRGTVHLELEGVVDTDPNRVDQLLATAIGIPSEKFFRSTASVRHFEMEDLDRDERALRDRLQASIGGGDVGASTARRKLDENIRRIRASGVKNPGPLKRAEDDIARLTAELRAGEAALERLSQDRAALAAAAAGRVALEAEMRLASEALEAAETAVRLEAERRAVAERYEHHRRATELAERLTAASADPPTAVPVAVIRAAVERWRSLELGAAQLAAERAAIATPVPAIPPVPPAPVGPGVPAGAALVGEPPPGGRPPGPPWRAIALVLGLLAVAALAGGAVAGDVALLGGVVLAVVLGALAAAAAVRDRGVRADVLAAEREREAARAAASARVAVDQAAAAQAAADAELRHRAAAADAEAAARQADAARAAIDQRLADAREETAELGRRMGVPDLVSAEALLTAADRHAATLDGLRAELRGLLGDEAVPDVAVLRAARDEAAARLAMASHALDGLGPVGADPEGARLRAQAALRGTRGRLQVAVEEQGHAEGRVSQNGADADTVAAIAEALTARQEEHAVLVRRVRVYEQTLAAITDAEAATMQKAARFLERRMGTDIARITGGRYDQVRVDEHDLAITVLSPERGDWIDAGQLSKGTGDQLYLAARLGLVRQVTQERRPPLVFDDPFVTFDDARALRAVELLRELADDHQVLYLTCSDRYDAAAEKVIELPAPTGP